MNSKKSFRYLWWLIMLVSSANTGFSLNDNIRIRIVSISWSSSEWQNRVSDTTLIEVVIGENFGSKNAPHYFKLLEVIDNQTIKISFSDEIVVAGEAVAYPSKQNPILITGETMCFRTRLHDAGTDYCISVIF